MIFADLEAEEGKFAGNSQHEKKNDEVSDLMFNAVAMCHQNSDASRARRMLKKTSLIAKINRWNSFQNMYDML